jgi:hypothetical protein
VHGFTNRDTRAHPNHAKRNPMHTLPDVSIPCRVKNVTPFTGVEPVALV